MGRPAEGALAQAAAPASNPAMTTILGARRAKVRKEIMPTGSPPRFPFWLTPHPLL
jgi:hypothetical protein